MSKFWKNVCASLVVSIATAGGLSAADTSAAAKDAGSFTCSQATASPSDFALADDICIGVPAETNIVAERNRRVAAEVNSVQFASFRSEFSSGAKVCADAPAEAKPEPGQHPETFQKEITIKLDYLLSIPTDYNKEATKKWPLILFLHGSGERGSNIDKVKQHGPPKIVDKDKDSVLAKEFIVVSPQCPAGQWWKGDDLIALLDDVQKRYHVDDDRVYVTGLSMGGFGTWELGSAYPDRFAAIAPMCGGGRPELARRMKNLPIWVFHGEADGAVPFARSVEMVEALKKAGNDVKFTSYPGVGHDCWTQSYANPELYTWFLSHKRGEKAAEGVDAKKAKSP
ncbi:MAG TPA: prolyl oligopeptidase family serine peptidase [Humisphaera sp.]|nr:prolyl oligopeptidase family serine peptidase [Humisphaera sp.]